MPDYTLYGLQSNPYKTKELDPLKDPAHVGQVVSVDGFAALKQVDAYLQTAVAKQEAAFVLVSGKSGTGRSSVANWVLARYCDLRKIKRERFIVPPRQCNSCDEFDIFRKWFAFLRSGINKTPGLKLAPGLSDELLQQPAHAVRELMAPIFSDLAWQVSESLAAQEFPPGQANPAAFGICLENVPKYDIIRAAVEIFEQVPTIAVFTTLDYDNIGKEVATLFRLKASVPEQLVELSPLDAQDITAVIEERWKKSSLFPNQPPFDPKDVGQKLGQPHRPLARVLSLMAGLIEVKLAEHGHGPAWPGNLNLLLTLQQIEQHIALLEGTYDE